MPNKNLNKDFTKLKQHDKDAFLRIYNELKIPVYTIAYRITKSADTAEDLTQDVFVKLFSSPPDESVKNYRAWVFAVTRNLAIDNLKKTKTLSFDDIDNIEQDNESNIITRLDIEEAMNILSLTEREIVTLHINAGLSFKEITKIINLSLPSTYRRYKKAISKLKILLSGGAL